MVVCTLAKKVKDLAWKRATLRMKRFTTDIHKKGVFKRKKEHWTKTKSGTGEGERQVWLEAIKKGSRPQPQKS